MSDKTCRKLPIKKLPSQKLLDLTSPQAGRLGGDRKLGAR